MRTKARKELGCTVSDAPYVEFPLLAEKITENAVSIYWSFDPAILFSIAPGAIENDPSAAVSTTP